ncbi:MAG: hypothetical protein LR005_00305 [Candidatus Pacebacteria bacterium]|nr:hypothetical protein [Candidatus Paceibacterota bacterium]
MKKPFRKNYIEDDIIMVHKPIGISSFGLISRMRRVLDTRKVGHAGTLDPLAHGLMIIGFNKGTKKMKNYVGMDKVYLAEIIIGKSTITGDREGDIVEEKIPYKNDMTDSNLDTALQSLVGEKYYPAPLYSAVKVLGKPLYKYARAGETPPFIPEKLMNLKKAIILDTYKSGDIYIVKIRAEVGSGTYIRTLAEEFGKSLGYPASLQSLYRLSIGKYLDKDAFRMTDKKSGKKYDIMKVYSVIKNLFRIHKK